MVYPDYQPVNDPAAQARFEVLWQTKMDPKAGLTVVEITEAIHGDDILGLYIMGENPAMSDPNASHARAALAKLQHLVVRDIFLTETACYADVVLPASAWPEKDGTGHEFKPAGADGPPGPATTRFGPSGFLDH